MDHGPVALAFRAGLEVEEGEGLGELFVRLEVVGDGVDFRGVLRSVVAAVEVEQRGRAPALLGRGVGLGRRTEDQDRKRLARPGREPALGDAPRVVRLRRRRAVQGRARRRRGAVEVLEPGHERRAVFGGAGGVGDEAVARPGLDGRGVAARVARLRLRVAVAAPDGARRQAPGQLLPVAVEGLPAVAGPREAHGGEARRPAEDGKRRRIEDHGRELLVLRVAVGVRYRDGESDCDTAHHRRDHDSRARPRGSAEDLPRGEIGWLDDRRA